MLKFTPINSFLIDYPEVKLHKICRKGLQKYINNLHSKIFLVEYNFKNCNCYIFRLNVHSFSYLSFFFKSKHCNLIFLKIECNNVPLEEQYLH